MSSSELIATTPADRHRFHALDALRGLAAVVIFFWHLPVPYSLYGKSNGYLAVDFFFSLSGFVVAFSYERRLLESLPFNRFVQSRIIRLYPTYLLGLTTGLAIYLYGRAAGTADGPGKLHILSFAFLQALLIPNLSIWPDSALFPFNDPSWSLFLEIVANITYGWAVTRRYAGTATVAALVAVSLLTMTLFMAFKGSFDVGPWNHRGFPFAFARVALSFGIGVLTLRAYRMLKRPRISGFAAIALTLLTAFLLLSLLLFPFGIRHSHVVTVFTVVFAFPVLIFAGAVCHFRGRLANVCAWLGNISYPFYVMHRLWLHLLYLPAVAALLHAHAAITILFTLVLFLVSAHFVFVCFDVPVRRWLSKVSHSTPSIHSANLMEATSNK